MHVRTFERLLHSKPEWHKSIDEARAVLGYDPSWEWNLRQEWEDHDCVANKQLTNLMALHILAEKAVNKVGFKDNRSLQHYWTACFYNDYKTYGLDTIMLWPNHWDSPRRVFPYIEWTVEFDPKERVYRIEFSELLTLEEITAVLSEVKLAAGGQGKGRVSLDVHRAKVRKETFVQKTEVADQLRRAAMGEITYLQAIQEEYKRSIDIEKDRIQSTMSKYTRSIILQKRRKLARECVRQRFKRVGLPTNYQRCDWWTEIEHDILED